MGENSLLERAANNLISNAIKFSPGDSQLKLTLTKKADTLKLSITDQGPGIDISDQADLFKPFIRNAQSQSEHGAGLGLSFVATVINRFHGEIELQNELGKGSTFSLVLPALSEEAINSYFSE